MDSTLISCEVIDELARVAGVGAEVAEITDRAMRGELDFDESFRTRLALLEGPRCGCSRRSWPSDSPCKAGLREMATTLKGQGHQAGHLFRRLYLYCPALAGGLRI